MHRRHFLTSLAAIPTLSLAADSITADSAMSARALSFQLSGGYQFADTFDVASSDRFIFAQAGHLTGAFLWQFADGREARTHINGATANRVTAQGAELFGTMKINMFEATGAAPDSELLYLAYEGAITAAGSKISVAVKGRFIGGTGRYQGASGEVELTSINGFFNDGRGQLRLSA